MKRVMMMKTFVIWSPGSTSLARLTPMMAAPFDDDDHEDFKHYIQTRWYNKKVNCSLVLGLGE